MKMKFLCENHRTQLSRSPDQAINCWQNGFETGYILSEEHQWREAIPHLGCAYETSEIILTTRAVEAAHAGEIFTQSAIMLANAFAKLECNAQFFEVNWLTVERLEREQSGCAQNDSWINDNLEMIYELLDAAPFNTLMPRARSKKSINNILAAPLTLH